MFFAEKDIGGAPVDYEAAVRGGLVLVPEGEAFEALSEDDDRMVEDGLLLNDLYSFGELMERCRRSVGKTNRTGTFPFSDH